MKDTQQCSKENKMKVKNEENQAVAAEKEIQADSFEKKNNLSGITMTKEENKEKKEVNCLGDNSVAVNCKGENPAVVNCKGDNPAVVNCKGDNQVTVNCKADNQTTERKISNEELDDLTSKVSDIQIADKKEVVVGRQNTVEEDTKRPRNQTSLDNDEEVKKRDGALTARGPNGGRASSYDNSANNLYSQQPEYKFGSNNNKRGFSEETEPAKYYKPVDYFPSQSHVNVKQLGGGTVTLKTPPVQHHNEPPYTFDSIPDGGDLIDALLAEQAQNMRTDFTSNIPVNMEPTNIYSPKHVKEENVIIDENSSSPYTNGGPPSNQSDSGISGMSYGSPYQNLSSPQSNASPPHVPEMGYSPVAPQYTDVLDLMDPILGREEDFQDVQKMIAADLLRDNKPPGRVREQIRPEIPHNHMMANQMNLINIKPQPQQQQQQQQQQQFQMNTQHCQMTTHNTMQQQATIFGHAPMNTNNIILPPCSQPSAVVHPIPVSNPVMLPQGPIPIGPVTPFTQPQIIIIQPGPIQAQRRPALRNIAPKTDKQTNKKPVQGPVANKGQKQPPRPDPLPVMQVRPTPSQIPNNAQQRPQNNQNNAQKRNLLNIARRMVAEIPSEQLRHQDDEGDTYLHVAACKSDPNLIQSLLERLNREQMDWLIDLENKKRMTPLYLAVLGNQPEMVEIFLKNNADPNALAQSASSPTEGKSLEVKAPIHVASAGGEESLPTLKKLLSHKDIALNIYNSEGHTALHTAIIAHGTKRQNGSYINNSNTIEALIKAGADPNSQDKKSGKTPLMYAIEKRDCILIEKMLRLFDPKKLRNVIKSSTFDGSNCLKIAEGRKSEFNPQEWQRLWDLLNKACTGELPRTVMLGY
ncbi:uncharacterized protein LOC143078651 isoform X1 [Mytilus galloprovincialis]|uniref:uncharacterized protein LOC143078651 isoform X1 n=2 Tax=Mytilus galloprovincialis TaxID=29158 RepID=UPI003F7C2965